LPYDGTPKEDLKVLRNMLASLRSGGACLIEVAGKEWLAKIFQPTTSEILSDGAMLVQRHEISDDWTRIRNEWILIRRGKAKSYSFEHTIYSGQELKDRMAEAGFVGVRLYGNLGGDEYGRNAERLIAVGRKP
jgi:hypothetical protein